LASTQSYGWPLVQGEELENEAIQAALADIQDQLKAIAKNKAERA